MITIDYYIDNNLNSLIS